MKKNDLKKLIKPLVKECIHEVLLEEGLLSSVVSEVAKGLQGNLVVEGQQVRQNQQTNLLNEETEVKRKSEEARVKLREHRKKLMDSIGSDAYNGVNLFEGTEATVADEVKRGSVDLGNPADSGVDISSLMGGASQIWKAMK